MSRFVRPSAAMFATRRSLGVSDSAPLSLPAGLAPLATSSVCAASAIAVAPHAWASSSGLRASECRPAPGR